MARRGGVRWGRFRVSGCLIEEWLSRAAAEQWDSLAAYMRFMGDVLIIRAKDHAAGDWIEYWGLSRHFQELSEGERIPLYSISFRTEIVCPCGERDNWDLPGPPDPGPRVCGNCGGSIEDATTRVEFEHAIRMED